MVNNQHQQWEYARLVSFDTDGGVYFIECAAYGTAPLQQSCMLPDNEVPREGGVPTNTSFDLYLAQLGAAGWEMVGPVPLPNRRGLNLLFKRQQR